MPIQTKKILQIVIALIGGSIITLGIGQSISKDNIKQLEVQGITFDYTKIKDDMATSTIERNIRYATLEYSTTTEQFLTIEKDIPITVSLDGYKRCLMDNKTKTICNSELERQIELNIKWFFENENGRIKTEALKHYQIQ